MKKFLNNLKQEASQFRLSNAEKAFMRGQLFGAASPMHVQKSPYVFFSAFSYNLRMVMAGLLLFVLAGAGTASAAAASALPGDLLYPIKINVNEAVKVALAPSPAAKAQVHAELADARVEEAQTLAAQGKLDATTTAQLAANFDEHAKSAQDLAQSVAVSDPAAAVQITTQLDSTLATNGVVLQTLGEESSSTATKNNSGRFATRVLAHVGATGRIAVAESASMPKSAEVRTMASSNSEGRAAGDSDAATIEAKAADVLASARMQFVIASSTIDATTTAQLEAQFADVDSLMSEGSASLGAGDGASATASFTAALSKAAQLRAVLKAQIKYDNGILKPLLRDGQDGGADGGIKTELQLGR